MIHPIQDLLLSTRITNSLLREGIKTIDQLVERSANDLLHIPFFGIGMLEATTTALQNRGLKLRVPREPNNRDQKRLHKLLSSRRGRVLSVVPKFESGITRALC